MAGLDLPTYLKGADAADASTETNPTDENDAPKKALKKSEKVMFKI